MLSRVSLGRGNSPPARTSSTHIIQGVLGIRFAPLLLYLRHAGFATISTRFCRFSPIFAPFSVFLAPWPHLPGGTRSRNTEPGGREPQNPLGGGEKNHAPGGEPGRAQHSAGAGDGLPPPSQGRSAAQRQRGGTHRENQAPNNGTTAGPRRGGRQAREGSNRQQGSTAARAASGRAATGRRGNHPPTTAHAADAPNGGRTAREKGRPCRPAAYRRCFVRQGRRSKRVGVVAPPRARNQPGQTPRRHPATGGARPHPAPRCRFVVRGRQRTGPLAPGGRWRDGVETGSLFALLYYIRCGSSTHAHQRERKCGRSRPVFHATEQHPGQGHLPGVWRSGGGASGGRRILSVGAYHRPPFPQHPPPAAT